jgi:hypothetical protein
VLKSSSFYDTFFEDFLENAVENLHCQTNLGTNRFKLILSVFFL